MKDCDQEVFRNGTMLAMVTGPRSTTIDPWVIGIAKATGQRVDWHMAGGRAIVKAIGHDLGAVCQAIEEGKPALVEAYMTAPDNWSKDPRPGDVQMIVYRPDDGRSHLDVVPHVTTGPDGGLVMHDPEAAAVIDVIRRRRS